MDAITIRSWPDAGLATDKRKKKKKRYLETVSVDMIDESEVLTPTDEERHIGNGTSRLLFVNESAKNLGEALRRVKEELRDDKD